MIRVCDAQRHSSLPLDQVENRHLKNTRPCPFLKRGKHHSIKKDTRSISRIFYILFLFSPLSIYLHFQNTAVCDIKLYHTALLNNTFKFHSEYVLHILSNCVIIQYNTKRRSFLHEKNCHTNDCNDINFFFIFFF